MGVGLHCLLTAEVPLCRSILSSLLHDYSRNVQWTMNVRIHLIYVKSFAD